MNSIELLNVEGTRVKWIKPRQAHELVNNHKATWISKEAIRFTNPNNHKYWDYKQSGKRGPTVMQMVTS